MASNGNSSQPKSFTVQSGNSSSSVTMNTNGTACAMVFDWPKGLVFVQTGASPQESKIIISVRAIFSILAVLIYLLLEVKWLKNEGFSLKNTNRLLSISATILVICICFYLF